MNSDLLFEYFDIVNHVLRENNTNDLVDFYNKSNNKCRFNILNELTRINNLELFKTIFLLMQETLTQQNYISLLKLASHFRSYFIVEYLLQNGATANFPDGYNPHLDNCFIEPKSLYNTVKILVENGAKISNQDIINITKTPDLDMDTIKLFVEYGANIHTFGELPLKNISMYSNNSDSVEVLKYFIDHGANIHIDNGIVLQNYIHRTKYDCIKLLLDNEASTKNISCNDLSMLVKEGNYEIIKLLVDHGLDLTNIYNYLTISDSQNKIVDILLEYGMDPKTLVLLCINKN
ncbi:MAG: hypothetical protein Satyrvirus7_26 [Satyrvirus sp.]|uniref:Ankyrin repeat protein n=1 Tax=Satyrvirus sp. TaxID=2487771 RepID=A0A3G5ADH1_9VIRU|nr:MAG: hypothetical protein Satyrvirus7_26 [Satyrvirus sp.]